jgi:pimeloyl-ACP methyl ester carboxylesterase
LENKRSPTMSRRFLHTVLTASLFIAAIAVSPILWLETATAQVEFVPAKDVTNLLGPGHANGAVIWSHGRSSQTECARTATPDYIEAFGNAGWDTFRLNRPRSIDNLTDSGLALANAADALKQRGYRRIVLAGQSFGAFLSLIAAGRSEAVDAVIGTSPAAHGSAYSNPAGYELNATKLYELLAAVRRARVALFFFEGDVFDPGGRGLVADEILSTRGLAHLVIDRPAGFSTHWASSSPAFATQYSTCLLAFAGGKRPELLDCPYQSASARPLANSGSSRPAQGDPMSVVNLEVGGRVNVDRRSRRR